MIKEIEYSGHTTIPSGYECPDGQLDSCLNLVPEKGAIHPIQSPKVIADIPQGYRVLLTHIVQNVKHFFLTEDHHATTTLYVSPLADLADASKWKRLGNFKGHPDTWSIVGNIVAISFKGDTFDDSDGLQYFRWRSSGYIPLGPHPPFIPIEFGWYRSSSYQGEAGPNEQMIGFRLDDTDVMQFTWSPDNVPNNLVAKNIIGAAYYTARGQAEEDGRLTQPVMIRYGLRLFDGTYAYVSPPALLPAFPAKGNINFRVAHGGDDSSNCFCAATAIVRGGAIGYLIDTIPDTTKEALKNWEDVIADIDIFISRQIPTIDIDEAIDGGGFGTAALFVISQLPQFADQKHIFTLDNFGIGPDDMADHLEGMCNFYKIATLRLDSLKTGSLTKLPVDSGFKPSNIPTLPLLQDDYPYLRKFLPGNAFSLNSRLNIGAVENDLVPPMPMHLYSNHSFMRFATHGNGPATDPKWESTLTPIPADVSHTTAYAEKDGTLLRQLSIGKFQQNGDRHPRRSLLWADSDHRLHIDLPAFIYYPEENAKWLTFQIKPLEKIEGITGDSLSVWLKLSPHPTLPGACWMPSNAAKVAYGIDISATDKDVVIVNEDGSVADGSSESLLPPDVSAAQSSVRYGNKIMTSLANNPFLFPYTGTTTVGDGVVRALASPTQALSQGQFGQFPLYAFCSDGVWALESSSDGSLVARQPVSRDVILPDSLPTQSDHAVLFPTERGIMMISGSQTICISDTIDTPTPFNAMNLPAMASLHEILGHGSDTCYPMIPLKRFLSGSGMVCDYVHQRIILFNPSISYAYIYSLQSKAWGMMHSDIHYSVNSYPEGMAITHGHSLVDFCEASDSIPKGLLITRPLKLDSPDVLKTIDTVIQRGHFRKDHVKSVLYGSRDLHSWHLVWSSTDHAMRGFRGTPYKYFRILLICSLETGESISGASVQFTQRLTNRLR